MTTERSRRRRKVTAAALLATVSLLALLVDMPSAVAEDCTAAAAPPDDLATPSMLYDTLRSRTNVQLLAIGFLRKPVDEECAWIYEVKVLTASGSVVELDLAADDLDLVGARGPENDRDAAAVVKDFGGDVALLNTDAKKNDRGAGGAASSGKGSGSDDGGEGGNSGSGSSGGGSGNSGSGGGDGGDGGGGGEGGGDGDHDGGDGGDDD
jgi:hypothetical protein